MRWPETWFYRDMAYWLAHELRLDGFERLSDDVLRLMRAHGQPRLYMHLREHERKALEYHRDRALKGR